jgi:hypothetical protein
LDATAAYLFDCFQSSGTGDRFGFASIAKADIEEMLSPPIFNSLESSRATRVSPASLSDSSVGKWRKRPRPILEQPRPSRILPFAVDTIERQADLYSQVGPILPTSQQAAFHMPSLDEATTWTVMPETEKDAVETLLDLASGRAAEAVMPMERWPAHPIPPMDGAVGPETSVSACATSGDKAILEDLSDQSQTTFDFTAFEDVPSWPEFDWDPSASVETTGDLYASTNLDHSITTESSQGYDISGEGGQNLPWGQFLD